MQLLDPAATTTENVGAVLSYLDEVREAERAERRQAAALCERHRSGILHGAPSLPVLHAVERGVAPDWTVDALRHQYRA